MRREQALEVIRQILNAGYCKSITLLSNAGNRPHDWQIKINNDSNIYSCIEKIVKENALAAQKEDSSLIIYEP